ncbi:S9 family peptidase [Pleurocapsales cyanobacterium LEGE 06147]|nr:S9 family peptidase [Pleurocapsales cyanobacterium LEGE 06147]
MTMPQVAPFGSWRSPITSDLIVSKTIGLGGVAVDGDDIYWLEGRPVEKGRNVLVRRTQDGKVSDVTPTPFNVRTRVHEYGGGALAIADGIVYFSNYADSRIYQQTLGKEPQPLTAESQRRYTDFILDRQRNRLICVCEDYTKANQYPENSLIAIDLATGKIEVLVSGSDFYSSPRLSSDGKKLAWLSWNIPNMPWDSTYLWLAKVNADGSLQEAKCLAGGEAESICEPKWSPDSRLYFSSDRTDWWNLYRCNEEGTIEPLHQMEAEFAYPHWVFGLSTYAFVSDSEIICTYSQNGSWHLGTIDTQTKQFRAIETPYTDISSVQATKAGQAVFIAGAPIEPTAVVKFALKTDKREILKRAGELEIDPRYLSVPEAIAFPTENGLTAYGWYYPPKNKDFMAPEGELPPLIVKSHGGPTAAASVSLSLRIQYWTSRGFSYLDVNYGGSIGYGRQYRQRLEKNWGIVDVDDCVNGAKYLVEQGKVDGDRLIITGSSAGGYTTLAALTFRDTFKAGASYYGISDLEILAKETHKFESRYFDSLIGRYPEEKALYEVRSPIHFSDRLSCPVIFFQGLEDKVVPPNQAEMMFAAIKEKGLPVAYVTFEDEGHGFRQAENIKKALDSELYFYSRIFGFTPADDIKPIEIFNLNE